MLYKPFLKVGQTNFTEPRRSPFVDFFKWMYFDEEETVPTFLLRKDINIHLTRRFHELFKPLNSSDLQWGTFKEVGELNESFREKKSHT